ncbi:MAG TPA: carbohydrate binding domain-containing protein, partial [Clostridia bacterium]
MIRKRLLSLGIAICMTASLFVSAVSGTSAYNDPAKKIIGYTSRGELVRKTDFKDGKGLPWKTVETSPGKASYEVSNGTYNVTVENVGVNKWDVQLRHRGIHIELNHSYTFKFTVSASKSCSLYAKVGDQDIPYDEYWNNNWTNLSIGTDPKTVTGTFTNTKKDQPYAEITFFLGNGCSTVGTTYKFFSVNLQDSAFPGYPIYEEASSDIRVNQLGYLSKGEKKATLATTSTIPVPWTLKDNTGTTVATGTTRPFGLDPDSGDNVQIIDFSSYRPYRDADGYTLTAGNATSFKFSIANNGLYSSLMYEALKYFYHNRSG